MNVDTFKNNISNEGFEEAVKVERQANGHMDVHSHPFEAKALILEGQIEIGLNGESQIYGPGDVFHLTLSEPHWERYGPSGVVYLSARKQSQ